MQVVFALSILALGAMLIFALRMTSEQKTNSFVKNFWFWGCALALVAVATLSDLKSPTKYVTAALPDPPAAAVEPEATPDSETIQDTTTTDAWQVLQDELSAKYNDQNYAILAIDLNDPTRRLAVGAEREMKTASVYKLFIAYSMLKAVDEGLDWNSELGGTTLADCFDQMIIESDNDCAHAWGDRHGWQAVMNETADFGSRIELLQENTTTTANELAVLLTKLYNKELLSANSRDRLLDTMKKQNYRQGIPAGVPNKVVADKVGFLNDVLTDAGIVYGNTGAYVLVILTEGYSWQSIAQTAALIDDGF